MRVVLVLLILLFVNCSEDRRETETLINFEAGEAILNHGELMLSYPPVLQKVVGQDSLIVFDEKSRQLVLFSLASRQIIWSTVFPSAGPHFLDTPLYDVLIRNNKLYLLSHGYLSVLGFDGRIVNRLKIDEVRGEDVNFELRSMVMRDNGKLIFPKLLYSALSPLALNQSDNSIFLEYDPAVAKTRDLPVISPPGAYLMNSSLGFYNNFAEHRAVLYEDKLIYSYPFSANIYTYDFLSGEKTSVEVKPMKTPANRRPINAKHSIVEAVDYFSSGTTFHPLHFDVKTGLFFRLHTHFPKKNTPNKIRKYLVVLDRELNLLEEIELNVRVFDNISVSNGHVYFWKLNRTLENRYELITYTFLAQKQLKSDPG